MSTDQTKHNARRLWYFALLVLALVILYLLLDNHGTIDFLKNTSALITWIRQQGVLGPMVIIALMVIAITMSPIPSAPIALAAGALYGHTVGTIYIVIGSALGATTAFYISRLSGINVTRRLVDDSFWKSFIGSQNTLMGIVFVSRLAPFISFDMVSYAAGITNLSFWRFAIATLAGIIPASFLLAHFGSELSSSESERIGITILLLGILPLAIIGLKKLLIRHHH